MHRGYVKLYRKSIENPLFKRPLIWHYFEYCLLKANHKEKKMIWNKKEITIERGSFLTGRIEAARETGLSEQNVRTAQKTLINVGALLKINEKSTSKHTYLTICNYEKYQIKEKALNQQPTSNQPASNQQPTTNNNEQTLKSTKKTKAKKIDSPEIDDFLKVVTEPTKKLCKENNIMQGKFKQLAESCFDHFRGKGEKKADWNATVRNWIRNDLKFNPPPDQGSQSKPRTDNFIP